MVLLGCAILVAVGVLQPDSSLTTAALDGLAAVLVFAGAGWALAGALDRNASRGLGRRSRSTGEARSSETRRADPPAGTARTPVSHAQEEPPTPAPSRPTTWSRGVFDLIERRRFEALCERLFTQVGFEMRLQPHGEGQGVDIWLYAPTQPDIAISLVKCRYWTDHVVKVAEVRELWASMAARQVQRGFFATTAAFSLDAIRFAHEKGIHLLDRAGLLRLIEQRTPAQQGELLALATEGDFWVPSCDRCGEKMHPRQPSRPGAAAWACVNSPRCGSERPT